MRSNVRRFIHCYPKGIRINHFSTEHDWGKNGRLKRNQMGFPAVWDVLRTMPDLVRVDNSHVDPTKWSMHPVRSLPPDIVAKIPHMDPKPAWVHAVADGQGTKELIEEWKREEEGFDGQDEVLRKMDDDNDDDDDDDDDDNSVDEESLREAMGGFEDTDELEEEEEEEEEEDEEDKFEEEFVEAANAADSEWEEWGDEEEEEDAYDKEGWMKDSEGEVEKEDEDEEGWMNRDDEEEEEKVVVEEEEWVVVAKAQGQPASDMEVENAVVDEAVEPQEVEGAGHTGGGTGQQQAEAGVGQPTQAGHAAAEEQPNEEEAKGEVGQVQGEGDAAGAFEVHERAEQLWEYFNDEEEAMPEPFSYRRRKNPYDLSLWLGQPLDPRRYAQSHAEANAGNGAMSIAGVMWRGVAWCSVVD